MEDVNIAFQYLLKLTPLLDKADQRCKYVLQNVATTIFSDCNLFVFEINAWYASTIMFRALPFT